MQLLEIDYNHRYLMLKNKSHIRNITYRTCNGYSRYREHRSIEGFRSSGGTLMHILSYSLSTGSKDNSMLWIVDMGHVISTFT